jgi:hypothetical protein
VPTAWKTSGSYRSASAALTAVTHGVVTPNMVSARAGLSVAGGTSWAIMPARACAALSRTRREIRFSPDTSVTEGSMARSVAPT